MRVSGLSLTLLAATITTTTASYILEDDYSSASFASMFDFFTGNDPTNGYVNYINQDEATSSGLYKVDNGAVYMGVDSTNTASGRGRNSIRISSKKTYNHGLIILDLAHMPAGACGTWPAFWLLGPNWPYSGEIDIIEGVNGQTNNNMAMHTDAGCSIVNNGGYSGNLETANCDVNAPDQATNAGCSISSGNSNSFGSGFNANNGGVYATEWTSEAINIWFFPRGSIPADITGGSPDPSGWGLPQGQFAGGCDIDSKIKNQQIVFDVTFCGDWAGNVWSTDATCSSKAGTCQDFVQNSPSAFQDTYWLINSLRVYTENGGGSSPNPTQTLSSSAIIPVPTSDTGLPVTTTLVTITSSDVVPVPTTNPIPTQLPTTAPVETTAPAATATEGSGSGWPWGGSGWHRGGNANGNGNTWADWGSRGGGFGGRGGRFSS